MADKNSRWLHELSWTEVERYLETRDIILVPIGATEQHGPHLPLTVDTEWAIALAEGAAELSDVLIAPPLHYGMSPHHMGYAGTVSLRPETLTAVTVDILESLVFHGFSKIIVINGNRIANLPALDIAAGKLRHRTNALVSIVDAGLIAKREVYEICGDGLGHAGVSETSMMLHRQPDLVDMSAAPSVPPTSNDKAFANLHAQIEPPFDANTYFLWPTAEEFADQTKDTKGVGNDPGRSTRELGDAICQVISRNLARYIEDEIRPRSVELKRPALPI